MSTSHSALPVSSFVRVRCEYHRLHVSISSNILLIQEIVKCFRACYVSDRSSGGVGPGDLFALGKAFTDTLLDRVGGAITDSMAEAQKRDAERRKFVEEFEQEVRARARENASGVTGATASTARPSAPSAGSGEPDSPAVPEIVDAIRAEIAQARASAIALKSRPDPRTS